MARKFLTAIDLAKNEIQNAVAQVLASDPSTPVAGQFYYNSTVGRVLFRNATAFLDYTARANHTGTQTAATISDFATTVQATRLDQFAAPTAAVSLNNQRITNLATPTVDSDAATKGYVDAAVNGTDVTFRLVDAVTGTVLVDNVVVTTNLPVNTTFLYAHAQIKSTVGTTAKLLALNRIYVETDL